MSNKYVFFGIIGSGVLCCVTGFSIGYVTGIVHPPKIGETKVISLPSNVGTVLPQVPAPSLPPQIPSQVRMMPSGRSLYAPSPAPVQGGPLSNPDIGRKVMQEVAKLHGVIIGAEDGQKIDETQVVTVFFDPRCPFCHSLFRVISGKIPVKWVPIPVLGESDEGINSSAFILSAKNGHDGYEAINTAFSYIGEGSVAHTPEDAKRWIMSIKPTKQQERDLKENVAAFLALHKAPGSSTKLGVPSVLVPMADGSISVHDGYDPGDENKIIADYRHGR